MAKVDIELALVGAAFFVLGFCLDVIATTSADFNEPMAFFGGACVANGVWMLLSAAK